ncbi:MAG: nucleotidyltransferase domain-containing protein [Nitrososphaerales archaeon]
MEISEPYNLIINKLLSALRIKLGDRLVSFLVYGSVARGEVRKDSDIDMLIIVRGLPKSRLRRQEFFEEVEEEVEEELKEFWKKGFYISFSPIIKTPEEALRLSPLYLDMVDDAIILYDKEDFFKRVLDRLKGKLKEFGARKVKLGKRWYWILKERYEFGEVINFE